MSVRKQLGKKDQAHLRALRQQGYVVFHHRTGPTLVLYTLEGGGFSVSGRTYGQAVRRAIRITEESGYQVDRIQLDR